jgi:Helix-turn-helix domain
MMLARALSRRTEPGKAYGDITAKALAVLSALLWGFHNTGSGKCFPSYEAIAERAGCARSTVAAAIRALERAGILTWVHPIRRVREWVPGLFGKSSAWRWRVVRTSNAYAFSDPASKSESQTRTPAQGLLTEEESARPCRARPLVPPPGDLGRTISVYFRLSVVYRVVYTESTGPISPKSQTI